MTLLRLGATVSGVLTVGLLMACGDDLDPPPGGADAGFGTTYSASGQVVDFVTSQPIAGSATISLAGLVPPPSVTTTGAAFTIEGISPFSVFHILSGSPPSYRNTYNVATVMTDMDVTGLTAQVVSEAYVGMLDAAAGGATAAGTGIVIVHAVDAAGAGQPDLAVPVFQVNGGPPPGAVVFLDPSKLPGGGLGVSSSSGYVVFYDVPTGLVEITATPGSGYTIAGANAPVAATTMTLADVTVTAGEMMPPTNVSFANDILPIFISRGCDSCHSGGGIGRDLGGLTLDGSGNLIHRELTEELSPNHGVVRVDLATPAMSLVLTLPGPEDPPDQHPNVTFASAADPDYQLLLAWITEGALDN